MSPQSYYFVNHTRKEFCLFDNRMSIFRSLELALANNMGWQKTDTIYVDSQGASDTHMWEHYVNDLAYVDVNNHAYD